MKHNIIKTDNYLLVVDDSEIKEGDYYLFNWYGEKDIQKFTYVQYSDREKNKYLYEQSCKKIIAHLPLGSPILQGVDLLPSLEQEDGIEKIYREKQFNVGNDKFSMGIFIDGYNTCKEKYKWTDEDVIKIVEKSRETGLTAEYLLLSLSQPKSPITFMFETEYDCCGRYENCKGCDATAEMINLRPKTTTNSQGQTILLGKYIY